MKSSQFLEEGFVEDAHDVHLDHEVQMARADCFHAAEDALMLHKLLRNIDEQQGLEGWVAAKLTLASDYLKTVREYLEYELMTSHAGDVEGSEAAMVMPEESANPLQTPTAPSGQSQSYTPRDYQTKEPLTKGADNKYYNAKGEQRDSLHGGPVTPAGAAQFRSLLAPKQPGKVNEMSAGSVATVVNPPAKNKAKVGSLFGGTYKQKKAK